MSKIQIKDISVRFEADTLTSVSQITAYKLVEIMESDSLESLIHLLLRNLAAETGLIKTSPRIAYPLQAKFLPKNNNAYLPDDGLPTDAELDAIGRIVPQDVVLKEISSLFEEHSDSKTDVGKGYDLHKLMSNVTEENKHERIDFGKPAGKEMP